MNRETSEQRQYPTQEDTATPLYDPDYLDAGKLLLFAGFASGTAASGFVSVFTEEPPVATLFAISAVLFMGLIVVTVEGLKQGLNIGVPPPLAHAAEADEPADDVQLSDEGNAGDQHEN